MAHTDARLSHLIHTDPKICQQWRNRDRGSIQLDRGGGYLKQTEIVTLAVELQSQQMVPGR
jgi:hypothetical protein